MRSTPLLVLAHFLAVLPVSLICLPLNLRIHMNQFVHSLFLVFLRWTIRLKLFRKLQSVATFLHTRDAAGKHIHLASLSGIGPVTPDECVRFANSNALDHVTPPNHNQLTIGNCLAACIDGKFSKGGVGNHQCCTCFRSLWQAVLTDQTFPLKVCGDADRGGPTSDDYCQGFNCDNDPSQFCGSSSYMALYSS